MAEDVENSQNFTAESRSSVKVIKNTKGYNWEVKCYDEDPDKALAATIRLEKKCQEEYGVKEA